MKMNFQITLFIPALIAICVGCDPKTSTRTEYKAPVVPDINVNIDEYISKFGREGGQPGSIKLSQAIAVEDSAGIVVPSDERLKLELLGGQGADGQTAAVNRKKAVGFARESSSSTLSNTQSPQMGTFINLGCGTSLDEQMLTAGLRKAKMKFGRGFLTMTGAAEKVFVCGARRSVETMVILDADELHLSNVDYLMKPSMLSLTITTRKLILTGANRLATQGILSAQPGIYPGAMIVLNVTEPIEGEGSLRLRSTGATFKKAAGLPGDK
jgi:hypothetical protein